MNNDLDPFAAEILEFWFGPDATTETVSEEKGDMWFANGSNYDDIVRERFGDAITRAGAGAFDEWCVSPNGRLALIVLTDQVPRHVHRGTPGAFATDAKAREVCLAGIKYETNVSFAVAHRDVIARFGYFPHRNEILGRPLNDEEHAFLQEPNSSF